MDVRFEDESALMSQEERVQDGVRKSTGLSATKVERPAGTGTQSPREHNRSS